MEKINTSSTSSAVESVQADNLPVIQESGSPKLPKFNSNLFLPISILIAAVLISGTILYSKNNSTPQPGQPTPGAKAKVDIKISPEDHVLGNEDAKVTIVEFSDFQCPFCRSFWKDTLSQIRTEYIDTGKAKLVYKHFPLDFHPSAKIAAQASECASEQSKFWEMHDKIYAEQEKLGTGTVQFTAKDLKKWAVQIGLEAKAFNACLDSGKYAARVDSDAAYGAQLGVSGTPSFFVNGQLTVGAQPFATFKALIDTELNKKGGWLW